MGTEITIIGTGLIGGSLAKSLRASGFACETVGADRDESQLKRAVELGVIDRYSLDLGQSVIGSEIVVLAVPVQSTADVLGQIKAHIDADTIVTDVGSCKTAVLRAAKDVLGDAIDRFVPGHPIAGREKSGVANAEADMFRRHRVILTPPSGTQKHAVQRVTEMWQSVGAEVTCLQAEQHDLVLGATSHLPHVLAYATVDTLASTEYVNEIFQFAAGGFRDFTRIASSDPVMWRDICLANKSAILDVMDQFEKQLSQIRQLIETEDASGLLETFAAAKAIRDRCLHLDHGKKQKDGS